MKRFSLLALVLCLSLPVLAQNTTPPPSVELLSLERPLPTSGEVGIPGVVELVAVDGTLGPVAGPTIGQQVVQALIQYVLVPLLPVLGGLLAYALKKLVDYLTAKSAESKGALVAAKLTGAAAAAVAEVNATLRPQLEKALEDGVLTDKEKAELKQAALNLLKTKLPAELLGAASGIFGGFLDTYLGGLLERELLNQKATAAIAARP